MTSGISISYTGIPSTSWIRSPGLNCQPVRILQRRKLNRCRTFREHISGGREQCFAMLHHLQRQSSATDLPVACRWPAI